MRQLVLAAFLVLSGCGTEDPSETAAVPDELRGFWERVAETCAGYPSKEHCDDGDMALFGGLLCAAGDERGCRLVRDAQGSDGRWWRSPRRNPGNLGEKKSFSRDQASGVLLYLATTRDVHAATRWVGWIERNRPCLVEKPWQQGCLVRGPHRVCTDEENQMCTLNPASWAVIGRVWDHLGLPKNDEMRRYDGADGEVMLLEADHAPLGYQTHLVGVEVYLKTKIGASRAFRERAATKLVERQPLNPFFAWLKDGRSPELARRVAELCPRPENGTRFRRFQWSWERDTASAAWRESMGWDCLFMARLLEGA